MNRLLITCSSTLVIILIGMGFLFMRQAKSNDCTHVDISQYSDDTDYYAFLSGTYRLIGIVKANNGGNKTYYGRVIMKNMGDHLEIIRETKEKTVTGKGRVVLIVENIAGLEIDFSSENFKETCMIEMDTDNYGILNCRLEGAGFETMFVLHDKEYSPIK